MRQVVQNFRSGRLTVADVPAPQVSANSVLVANVRSLISAGTEKSTVDVARKSLVGKALERPEMVAKVLDKVRKDGVGDTLKMVMQRLDAPVALGYSCAGVVIDVGRNVRDLAVGDRVACAGQNHASHAEIVRIPRNLCTRIPDGVDFDSAAYVTLGAIALQSVRQAEPRLGETVAVIGLGLLGQLVVQLLKANGCRVLATDIAADRLALARRFGADVVVDATALSDAAISMTGGHGVDAVIIAASTRENAPIEAAALICRRKGRIVVLGAVAMSLPREPFYLKELELRLSTSYGPGRYDPEYEEKGSDYPYGYVRWTEGRNMAAFLWLLHERKVDCAALTTHRYEIGGAEAAYRLMLSGEEPYLGILLAYPDVFERPVPAPRVVSAAAPAPVSLGLIGAGNHVRDMLLPHLAGRAGVSLRWVCTGSGITANALADRLSIAGRTTDYREVLADPTVNAVVIGTRHDSHARLSAEALAAGKHVFVEKPLCLDEVELEQVRAAHSEGAARGLRLRVGFNRRYSSHAREARDFLAGRQDPLVMLYRVNAGAVPREHWTQDIVTGGGRIVGEGCHFVDLMSFVCGALPVRVRGAAVGQHSSGIIDDHCVLELGFADGSIGSLVYAAGGDRALAKERFEAFGGGRAVVIDDYLVTELHAGGKVRRIKSGKRDKGFAAEMAAFCDEIAQGAPASMRFEEIEAVSRICLLAARSLQTGETYTA